MYAVDGTILRSLSGSVLFSIPEKYVRLIFGEVLNMQSPCTQYMSNHPLNCFVVVFVCAESSANNGSGNEACLTVEALDALGFLITGVTDGRLVIASNDTLCCRPISQDFIQGGAHTR